MADESLSAALAGALARRRLGPSAPGGGARRCANRNLVSLGIPTGEPSDDDPHESQSLPAAHCGHDSELSGHAYSLGLVRATTRHRSRIVGNRPGTSSVVTRPESL